MREPGQYDPTAQRGILRHAAEGRRRQFPEVQRHRLPSRRASGHYSLRHVERSRGPVEYAVNAPLESGKNLRDIDPGALVEEFVDLKGVPAEPIERGDYLCVFVAGAKNGQVWPWSFWIPAIKRLARRLDTKRIALIGAEWDKQVQDPIAADLKRIGFEVRNHVGSVGLPGTIDIIRRARFFLGYQSGLNVLAENYDVDQGMFYFPKLRAMMYTWCKPQNIKTKFHAMTFDDDANAFIDALPLHNVSPSMAVSDHADVALGNTEGRGDLRARSIG